MEHLSKLVTFSDNKNTCINFGKRNYIPLSPITINKGRIKLYIYVYIPQKKTFLERKIKPTIISYLENNDNKITII